MEIASISASSSPARPDHNHPPFGHALSAPGSNVQTPSFPNVHGSCTSVETRMRKSTASFTASFIGLSGFASEVGCFTSSPIVELEERFWSVRIYPGGIDEESKGFLSCYIVYESRGTARCSYKITMVNQMNWKNRSVTSDSVKDFAHTHDPRYCAFWGESKFISHADLKLTSNGHCVEDTIVIRVDLTIYGPIEQSIVSCSTHKLLRPSDYINPHSLQADLASLLFHKPTADLTITCGDGEHIPAHKFMLCLRSDVFRAMFEHNMLESATNTINITDFDSVVVTEMVRYIYTDTSRLEDMQGYCDQLLAIACKYGIKGLMNVLENHMITTLNIENIVATLRMADMCNAEHLKSKALLYVAHNAKQVMVKGLLFDSCYVVRVLKLVECAYMYRF
ncbi:BTB/POZ domain-containing protein [archaeon]|nr:MAG: BTB/POZ domain-containing protein [archaeon]